MLAVLFAVTSASLAFAGGRSRHKDSGDVQILHVTPRNTQQTDLDLGASVQA
jgi:citrate lyase gamma subunit